MKINGQELVAMSAGAHMEAPVGGFAKQAMDARCDRFLDERGIGSGDFQWGRNSHKRGRPRKAALLRDPVELRCPRCRRAHKVERGTDIPSRAETVLFPCTECLPAEGTLPEVLYLDWKNAPLTEEETADYTDDTDRGFEIEPNPPHPSNPRHPRLIPPPLKLKNP